MSKSYSATKRDLRMFCEENDDQYDDVNWKLTRHPNGKKKHEDSHFRHTFGSPKHAHRNVVKRDKQRDRQLDRNNRRQTARQIIAAALEID